MLATNRAHLQANDRDRRPDEGLTLPRVAPFRLIGSERQRRIRVNWTSPPTDDQAHARNKLPTFFDCARFLREMLLSHHVASATADFAATELLLAICASAGDGGIGPW
jgi:hypothetical protein